MPEINIKWNYPLGNKETIKDIRQLMQETGLTKDEVAILYNRGIRNSKDIKEFLNLSLADLYDTRLLKDSMKVVNTIIKHINCGNKIVIYSDYDADGWGCIIVSMRLLGALGADITWYTNNREMGYGCKPEGVDELMSKTPDTKLIITTDNGIVAFEGIEHAVKDYGVEVCVIDHHAAHPNGKIPECSGVVDHKRLDDDYPFDELCGTGLVYKICKLVYEEMGANPRRCDEMLDVVAISTVADVVPLVSENRIMVKEGLRRINSGKKFIWRAMKDVLLDSRFETEVSSKTIGFTYAPSINACSRLTGDIEIPLRPFLLEDTIDNLPLMRKEIELMKSINEERKSLSSSQTEGVQVLVEQNVDDAAYIINHSELNDGIVGIIAGRICEKYNKPCIVLTNSREQPNIWKGSGRSIDDFNIKVALDDIQERTNCLKAYGGHAGACGLTIEEKNLQTLKDELIKIADFQIDKDKPKEILIDYAHSDEFFDIGLYDRMKSLEPFGKDFESPTYGIRMFNPKEVESFGGDPTVREDGTREFKHVKFLGENIDYIAWNSHDTWKKNGEVKKNFNALGELRYDAKNKRLQLSTMDFSTSFSKQ